MGAIDGNAPKQHKSTKTRRATNATTDIAGTVAKDRGSIPMAAKQKLSMSTLQTIPEN